MYQAIYHHLALALSEKWHRDAAFFRCMEEPGRALFNRAMAVVAYDRTLTHWSIARQKSV